MMLLVRPLILVSFPILGILVGACDGKVGKRSRTPLGQPNFNQNTYFIHGDVESLVAGTNSDLNSPFNVSNAAQFQNYAFAGLSIFKERIPESEVEAVKGQQDLEEKNSTDREEEPPSATTRYQFVAIDAQLYTFQSATGYDLRFHFLADAAGNLNLNRLTWPRSGSLAVEKVRHYSIKEDGSIFSILFEFQDPVYGKSIGAAYFTKLSDNPEDSFYYRTDEKFSYLLGSDVAIGWEKELDFGICGENALQQKALIKRAIDAWNIDQAPGKIGYLRYKITENPTPPPFSDVNSTCIYFSDSYRFEDKSNALTLGLAMTVFNYSTARIVSSSVFIATNSHQGSREQRLEATTIHEIGHVLGLGHEFKRDTLGQLLHDSVMGYGGVPHITRRDKDAIAALYPKVDLKERQESYDDLTAIVTIDAVSQGLAYELKSLVLWSDEIGIDQFVMEARSLEAGISCSPKMLLEIKTLSGQIILPNRYKVIAQSKRTPGNDLVSDCFENEETFVIKGSFERNLVKSEEIVAVELSLSRTQTNLMGVVLSSYNPVDVAINQFELVRTVEGMGRRLNLAFDYQLAGSVIVSSESQILFFNKQNILIQSSSLGQKRTISATESLPIKETLLTPEARVADRAEVILVFEK